MKAQRGSTGIAPLSPNLGARWSEWSSRSGRFSPRKEPRYPLKWRLGGPHSQFGHVWRWENLFQPRFELWSIQPVVELLYWLCYPSHHIRVNEVCKTTKNASGNISTCVNLLILFLTVGYAKNRSVEQSRGDFLCFQDVVRNHNHHSVGCLMTAP
jgi:hypothetical protein